MGYQLNASTYRFKVVFLNRWQTSANKAFLFLWPICLLLNTYREDILQCNLVKIPMHLHKCNEKVSQHRDLGEFALWSNNGKKFLLA